MGTRLCLVTLVIAACTSKPSDNQPRPVEPRPVEPAPDPHPQPPPKVPIDPAREEAEARAEVELRKLIEAVKVNNRAAAEAASAKIPDTSIYRAEATKVLEKLEPPAATSAKPGDDCSKGQACGVAATCVSYLGIAGARGPTFKTCEIRCTAKTACPSGTSCLTIADGPGQVCR